MFGLLKDKLAGFVNKLIKREEDKPPAPAPAQPPKEQEPISQQKKEEKPEPKRETHKKEEPKKEEKREEKKEEKRHEEKKEEQKKHEEKKHESKHEEKREEKRHEPKHEEKAHKKEEPKKHEEKKHEEKREEKRHEEKKPEHKHEMKEEPKKHEEKKEEKKLEHKHEEKKPELKVHEHIPAHKPVQVEAKPAPIEAKPAMEEEKPLAPEPISISQPKQEQKAPAHEQKNILSSIWPFGKKKEEPKEEAKNEAKHPIEVKSKTEVKETILPVQAKPASAPTPKTAPVIASSPTPASSKSPETKTDLQMDVPDTLLGEADMARLEKKVLSEQEREMKVKMGLGKSVLGFLAPQVTIEEGDVRDLLDDLELALLESDVAFEVSTEVTSRLRKKLVGLKVQKGQMEQEVQKQMKGVLTDIMTSTTSFDFLERVAQRPKPVKILFVGPNGAGKTTTMAKIAQRLMNAKMTVVFAAGDTFRAAAIEQTEVHAKKLGIPVIKSNYGADPASVAFDAVNYAKAHKIDVVLIDSAGRQDTNANLLDELKKINRVISPDLKIYIGESIGGHALVEQIRAFHEAIGVDGAILTKLDCDAKGGTAISLTYATGVPILFLGTGQAYEDLKPFDAEWVAGQILT